MPWTAPPTFTPGEALPALKLAAFSDLLTGGVMRPIAETLLTVATAQIDFAALTTQFRSLALVYHGSSDAAVASTALVVRFNTDSNSIYSFGSLQNSSTTASGADGLGQNSAQLGSVPGTTGSASAMGTYWVVIPGYQLATRFKNYVSYGGNRDSDAAGGVHARVTYGTYQSASAITHIRLFLGSGNHGIGTLATLYGLPN